MKTKTVKSAFGLVSARIEKADVIVVKGPYAKMIKKQFPTSQEQALEMMSRDFTQAMVAINPLKTYEYYLASETEDSITLVRVKG